MRCQELQLRRLVRERASGCTIEVAAMRAGMHRNTASRHLKAGTDAGAPAPARTWRTHKDVFEADWPMMAAMLHEAPELEAKALFEHLQEVRPGLYGAGHLRTFQRRASAFRRRHGVEKEIFFPQLHRPGEAAQTDFTWATELGITIRGTPHDHMLCVSVLSELIVQSHFPFFLSPGLHPNVQ